MTGHFKDIYEPTSIMESNMSGFSVAKVAHFAGLDFWTLCWCWVIHVSLVKQRQTETSIRAAWLVAVRKPLASRCFRIPRRQCLWESFTSFRLDPGRQFGLFACGFDSQGCEYERDMFFLLFGKRRAIYSLGVCQASCPSLRHFPSLLFLTGWYLIQEHEVCGLLDILLWLKWHVDDHYFHFLLKQRTKTQVSSVDFTLVGCLI